MKITIITVCRNSEKYIEETITSVVAQTYSNIEYIIVDGKSTDRTMEIVNRYKGFIAHVICEEDASMYDALNKGLSLATGDYILNINSDDILYYPNVIKDVVTYLGGARPDAFYCNLVKQYGTITKKIRHFSTSFFTLLCSKHGSFVPHPVFFISKAANDIMGGYNLSYKYASDFDYILGVLRRPEINVLQIPIMCVMFRVHDESYTGQGKISKERVDILKKHGYYEIPFLKRTATFYLGWSYYLCINFTTYFKFYLNKFLKKSA